ncbi:hypothetical protein COM13_12735 [Bacillus pseudomycoides]|nr:hypothetical protein COO07_26250 [Bacillus pseudomycoides]PEK78081.1 hypothetical protein CN597_17405 [Bacillus pseudomycoides]PEM98715.1 hypothetical protein CN640_30660 [Bacillus pseudomycoides]PGB88848.1 hypothetical protein COM13_12735 [Bacillus pseudomycoides]PHE53238.1 hypothetical protein COF52_26530 [Bacillus pseudomycoides]
MAEQFARRREAKNISRKRVGARKVPLATHLLSGTVQDLNDVRSGAYEVMEQNRELSKEVEQLQKELLAETTARS